MKGFNQVFGPLLHGGTFDIIKKEVRNEKNIIGGNLKDNNKIQENSIDIMAERSRTQSGRWRKKRSDAGKKRKKKSKGLLDWIFE